MEYRFKPGDLVNHKGFGDTREGKGGRFIVIEQLGWELSYKLKFLYTPGPLQIWDKWNETARKEEYGEEHEDYLVIDVAYHRQNQLKKLGI